MKCQVPIGRALQDAILGKGHQASLQLLRVGLRLVHKVQVALPHHNVLHGSMLVSAAAAGTNLLECSQSNGVSMLRPRLLLPATGAEGAPPAHLCLLQMTRVGTLTDLSFSKVLPPSGMYRRHPMTSP